MTGQRVALQRSGARAACRVIVATAPVTAAVVLGAVGLDADSGWVWLAGPAAAAAAYCGVAWAMRSLGGPRESRIAAALTLTLLGISVGLLSVTPPALLGFVLVLAMPQIAWIALFWVGRRDLLRRIVYGLLAIFPATFLAVLAAGGLASLYDCAPGWLRPAASSEVPGAILGFAVLELLQSLVIWACIGPRLVKRSRLTTPPVFAADGYELLTVIDVADGHVRGRLDDGREVRTAVPGAVADPGSRWLVRVVASGDREPVARLRWAPLFSGWGCLRRC